MMFTMFTLLNNKTTSMEELRKGRPPFRSVLLRSASLHCASLHCTPPGHCSACSKALNCHGARLALCLLLACLCATAVQRIALAARWRLLVASGFVAVPAAGSNAVPASWRQGARSLVAPASAIALGLLYTAPAGALGRQSRPLASGSGMLLARAKASCPPLPCRNQLSAMPGWHTACGNAAASSAPAG